MAGKTYSDILLWLVAGLALGAAAYLLFLQPASPAPPAGTPLQPTVNKTNGTAAAMEITIINPAGCAPCRPLGQVLPQLEEVVAGMNLTIGSVRNLSETEGAALIAKYRITKLPAMVVTGNYSQAFASDWMGGAGTQESDGALVLRNIYPPYYENGRTVGVVEGITIVASDCPECLDPAQYFSALEDPQVDMIFSKKTRLQENDTAAQALIAGYNITKLPALLLSEDASAYPLFDQYLLQLGETKGGWFILRNATAPYIDLQTRTVHGLVEAVFIVNSSCSDCFNASDLSAYMLQDTGVTVVNGTTYEANSTAAKALVAKYRLRNIPALLYSPEASTYSGFTNSWLNEGNTVESDGWYVFRAYDSIAVPYQNAIG